jgi:hypothetical protein
MKKTIFLLATIWISLNSFSQDPITYIQQDTLSQGVILFTVQPEGGLWSQYLQLPDGQETEFDFTYLTDNTGLDGIGEDYLISNLYTPDNFGGCLPLDACYNPTQNKLYFYGGQNIIVVDALTCDKIKEIKVSETFNYTWAKMISGKESHYLVYNPQYNKVFCATLAADLVVIDCNTDEIVNTINSPEINNFHSTSIALGEDNDFLYWYVNDIFTTRYLNKVDCQTNNRVLQRGFSAGIFDIVCDNNDATIYLSAYCHPTNKIHAINTSNLQTIAQFGKAEMGKMVVNNATDILYVDDLESSKVLAYDLNTYSQVNAIDVSFDILLQSACNSSDNLIYFSGFEALADQGLTIIDGAIGQEVKVYPGEFATIGLLYNASMNVVFNSCRDKITAIDGTDYNQVIDIANNEGGTSVRLISGQGQSVISANQIEGTATAFDLQNTSHGKQLVLDAVVQIGGSMVSGCYNETNEKVYYIQHSSSNQHSYLTVYDANTLNNLAEIPIGPTLRDIKYNKHNNKIYVSCFDDKKIIPIDGESNQILENEIIDLQYNAVDIFVSSLNKIYVSTQYYVLIYDGNAHQLLNTIYAPGWKEFEENTNLQIVYASQSTHYNITAINAVTNQKIADIATSGSMVSDMCYSASDNFIFVSYYNEDVIDVISGTNLTTTMNNMYDVRYLENNYLEDKVYALAHTNIYVIKHNTVIETIDLTGKYMGLLFNDINNKIYTHQYYDDAFKANIIAVDCNTDEICSVVQLPQKIHTGLLVMTGGVNDLVFSKHNNRVFCGTRAFSSICAVQCNTERLPVQNGWNWLSFPRLERSLNNYAPAIPVLKRINYYPDMELTLIEDFDHDPKLQFINQEWSGELTNVRSTSGYKLDLDLSGDNLAPEIELHGMQLDPETEMNLYPGQENWTGYFVDYPQTPFECFDAATWANLTEIRTRYWAMIKGENAWWIKGRVTPFNYGDLVILKTETFQTFQWVNGEEAEPEEMPKTSFYTYNEQADYLPVYVIFDDTSAVQEVAISVDGEVVGAAVRQSGDTIVQVNAYLDGSPPGATMEFETWEGFKSSKVPYDEYLVYNSANKKMEKRGIYTGEKKRYQLVSFKKGDAYTMPANISDVSCLPNPFGEQVKIGFLLNEHAGVAVEIFDINGKKVNSLLSGELPAGYYNASWHGDMQSGAKVNKGIYFYKITINKGIVASGKIVFIK